MDYSNYKDIELLPLLRENKQIANNAFNIIYFRYSAKVFGYCLFRSDSRADADELMQDTWLNFYNAVINGKSTNNILSLLLSIARNLSINKYYHNKTQKIINLDYYDSSALEQLVNPYNFQNEEDKNELLQLVQIAINNLDDIYRDVLLLYWFGGLKFCEIAAICNENEAALRKRFERAMKKIDVILKPYLV
jgi:RNA polymerase sigma-70 factor (ECF subfamily)